MMKKDKTATARQRDIIAKRKYLVGVRDLRWKQNIGKISTRLCIWRVDQKVATTVEIGHPLRRRNERVDGRILRRPGQRVSICRIEHTKESSTGARKTRMRNDDLGTDQSHHRRIPGPYL